MPVETIRELYEYNRWANDRVMNVAVGLSDEQLDRPFDMGSGSLRKTLRHIYGAERFWYERVKGPEYGAFPRSRDVSTASALFDAACRLATARTTWLDSLDASDLDSPATYTLDNGVTHTDRLGDILLHVCNHDTHHRAQALNMLRQMGAVVPEIDYIEWIREIAEKSETV